MSNVIEVDLDKLKKEGKILLSGRDNGKKAFLMFGLDKHTPGQKIVVRNGASLVLTNSYFLGMFEGIIIQYKEKSELLENLDYTAVDERNKKELTKGINRGFSEIINPLS